MTARPTKWVTLLIALVGAAALLWWLLHHSPENGKSGAAEKRNSKDDGQSRSPLISKDSNQLRDSRNFDPKDIQDFYSDITTFEAWLAKCSARIPRFPPGTPEYGRYGRTLLALFRRDPSLIEPAIRCLLEDKNLGFYVQCLIIEAIGYSDDPVVADNALRKLLTEERLGDPLKVSVLSSIGLSSRVSDETALELIRRAQTSDRLGRLSLETLGRLVRKDSILTAALRREVLDCLVSLSTALLAREDLPGVQSSLMSLAYAKTAELEAPILQALRHSNPAIRSYAVKAWSFMDLEGRSDQLLQLLTSEHSPMVRQEVVRGLYPVPGGRQSIQVERNSGIKPEIVDRLLIVCREDPDEQLRHAALEFFANCYDNASTPPNRVLDTLRTAAQSDPSEVNREYSAWILKHRYTLSQ